MSDSAHILIVDDQQEICDVVQEYLTGEGYRVSTAHDGTGMRRVMSQSQIDLVILDLMLPGKNGLEVCAALRVETKLPIIMLTARSTEDDKLIGLETGADDYVTKPFSPRELVARVRAVLRRVEPTDEEPLIAGDVTLDRATRDVIVRGTSVSLTAAEFRLLETLMRAPGRVFTRDELVEGGLDRTVDVHIKNLRRKIEIDRANPTRIVTVFGVGYKFV
jgi:DNA-binding response OmpR family regulator